MSTPTTWRVRQIPYLNATPKCWRVSTFEDGAWAKTQAGFYTEAEAKALADRLNAAAPVAA